MVEVSVTKSHSKQIDGIPECSKWLYFVVIFGAFLIQVHVHSDLESWYKDVPMRMLPVEYLPDDYTGPCAGRVDDIKG